MSESMKPATPTEVLEVDELHDEVLEDVSGGCGCRDDPPPATNNCPCNPK